MRGLAETDLAEILNDVQPLIKAENKGSLKNILIELHPADIAYILLELKKEERKYLFNLLETDKASDVLTELDQPIVEQLLEEISEKEIVELVDQMDSDDAADIISGLPDEVADRVLDQVTDEVSEEVKELLLYEEDTAGGIMALEFVFVNEKSTVTETIEAIRKAKEEMDVIHAVWVVDDANVLKGKISITDLVLARGNTQVEKIMNTDIQHVHPNVDQEEVAGIFSKYDLVVIPVVSDEHKLIGEITIDDILDVLEEEAAEDLSRFSGAHDHEISEESIFKISWLRFPWLIIAFIGELISALIIRSHEATLQQVIALTFFIPVIMAMGGNSGIQASIIVIRGLATGEITMSSTRRRFFRELGVSLIIGFLFGLLMVTIIGFWLNNYHMGIMVGLALNIVIIQSALFGGLVPFILKKLNIDPALASGPFITTFNDVLGLLIYLLILTISFPLYF